MASEDRSSWRAIQQDSPVDAYMQSTPAFGGYEPFYPLPVGSNDNLDLFDVNFGLGPIKPEANKLGAKGKGQTAKGGKVLGKHKLYDQVATPYVGLNPKVDSYINSILAEGAPGELPASVDQAEIISFLDSQFRVALDPLLISSVAAAPTQPVDPAAPAPKPKKKRKQSGLQDLEPEIERELAKFPAEEREKQRKVLKNRLAARTFRRRQKEHISEMASQIDNLSEENLKLKSALKLMAMENKMIKEQLGYIKSFLAPFGGVPGVMESSGRSMSGGSSQQLSQQQHGQQQSSQQHAQQQHQQLSQQSHGQQHPHGGQQHQQPSHQHYQSQYSPYGQGYGVNHNYNSFAVDFNDASNAQLLESYFNMENM